MFDKAIPKNMAQKAFQVFLSEENLSDPYAALALQDFMLSIRDRSISMRQARNILANPENVLAYIVNVGREKEGDIQIYKSQLSEELRDAIMGTHANSKVALSAQAEMRREFGVMLSELHSATRESVGVVEEIKSVTGAISANVVKAVENTSTKIAVAIALTTGFVTGLISSIPGNAIYERHFSIEALKKATHASTTATPQVSPPPMPGGAALQTSGSIPLPMEINLQEQGGLDDAGPICKRPSPPVVCAPGAVQGLRR